MKSRWKRGRFAGQTVRQESQSADAYRHSSAARRWALVAGSHAARCIHGFSQSPADRSQHERGDLALRRQGEIGSSAGKFGALIKFHPRLAQELGGESHVFGAVHAPETEFLLVPLEKVQTFLELLHGPVKRGSEEVNREIPGVPGVEDLDSNAILAGLVAFHAAAVVIADGGCASRRLLLVHKVLRFRRWGAIAEFFSVFDAFSQTL